MKNILFILPILLLPLLSSSQDLKDASDPGVIYSFEFAFGAGVGNVRIDNSILDANYERTYGLKFLSAYRFDSDLSVGASAMYDYFSDSGFLLLGGDIRYFTNSADFSPFISANLGYGISIGNQNRDGGFYYYPSAGVRIDIDKGMEVLLSLGYKRQYFVEYSDITLSENGEMTTIEKTDNYNLGFLSISAGVMF